MMSKLGIAVVVVVLAIASVSFAQEPPEVYTMGGMVDRYAGPTPSGMRFGDGGHVVQVQTGDVAGPYMAGGCSKCRFGVPGAPCDPAWGGPCLDWKLVGWYSSWHNKFRGCYGHGHGCKNGCRTCCY